MEIQHITIHSAPATFAYIYTPGTSLEIWIGEAAKEAPEDAKVVHILEPCIAFELGETAGEDIED